MEKKLVSLIIRSKNEEKWIKLVLDSIYDQTIKNLEIILVDNNSVDNTIKIAKSYGVKKICKIKKFIPGAALNKGCNLAIGKYLVFLSAHCIPENKYWLKNLISKINENEKIIASYGRQLPLSYSNANDVRDLLITFGKENKLQSEDPFFHNANSAILYKYWKKFKFSETVSNIEDRFWAKQIQKKNYKIYYNANAAVFHHHGIHHSLDNNRSNSTFKVLNKIDNFSKKKPFFLNPKNRRIDCLIFISKKDKNIDYSKKIDSLKKNLLIDKIHIFSDDKKIKNKKILFYDIKNLEKYSLDQKFKKAYSTISKKVKNIPELIVYLNLSYKSLTNTIINKNLDKFIREGCDTLIPVIEDFSVNWKFNKELNEYIPISKNLKNRKFKKPILKSLFGLGTITSFVNMKSGDLISGKYSFNIVDKQSAILRNN